MNFALIIITSGEEAHTYIGAAWHGVEIELARFYNQKKPTQSIGIVAELMEMERGRKYQFI